MFFVYCLVMVVDDDSLSFVESCVLCVWVAVRCWRGLFLVGVCCVLCVECWCVVCCSWCVVLVSFVVSCVLCVMFVFGAVLCLLIVALCCLMWVVHGLLYDAHR